VKKPVTLLIVLILWIVAAIHLIRFIFQVPVTVGDFSIPLWISIPGFIVPPVLATLLMREVKESRIK
jgi:hypothetical protein